MTLRRKGVFTLHTIIFFTLRTNTYISNYPTPIACQISLKEAEFLVTYVLEIFDSFSKTQVTVKGLIIISFCRTPCYYGSYFILKFKSCRIHHM